MHEALNSNSLQLPDLEIASQAAYFFFYRLIVLPPPRHHRFVYQRVSVVWVNPMTALPGLHPDTLLWAGTALHFQQALHLCFPAQLSCRVSKPYVPNARHYSFSLQRKEGFLRCCSVIVGEREVFVILAIPLCLDEILKSPVIVLREKSNTQFEKLFF